ncbi:hypothetical protein PORY_002630 [Pneumocystis oryctolagi]|uniref:Uncharacterized protein n=1 Tax=Pneumocystis oryctolagi TaxID=42067 RepID=A0ACB7C8H3_9ASCO|nr:hypothetical protein PORY_002630 [Pneumocystis oryctolagi]
MHQDKENIIVRAAPQTPAPGIGLPIKLERIDGQEGKGVKGYPTGSLITPLQFVIGQRQILGGKDTNTKNIPVSLLNTKSLALNTKLSALDNGLDTISSELHTASVKKPINKSLNKSSSEKNPVFSELKPNDFISIKNPNKILDPEYMPPKPKELEHCVPGFSPIDWSLLQEWPFYRSYFNRLDDQGQSEIERNNKAILKNPTWESVDISVPSSDFSTAKPRSPNSKSFGYQKLTESFRRKCNIDFSSNSEKKTNTHNLSKRTISSLDDFGLTLEKTSPIDDHFFFNEPFSLEL